MCEVQGHRSKVKVTMSKKTLFANLINFPHRVKGLLGQGQRSDMGQGQRSYGPRSDKGSKQRQVGSHQRQVASLYNLSQDLLFFQAGIKTFASVEKSKLKSSGLHVFHLLEFL